MDCNSYSKCEANDVSAKVLGTAHPLRHLLLLLLRRKPQTPEQTTEGPRPLRSLPLLV